MTISATQKMKFSIRDSFSKCNQIRRKLRIWSHLLKKSLMENFIFCAVFVYISGLRLPFILKKIAYEMSLVIFVVLAIFSSVQ